MNTYILAIATLASLLSPVKTSTIPIVQNEALAKEPSKPAVINVWVTAYSSSPDETDDTPHLTASMTHVRDGIVATNILPFGTLIQIPSLFGDKIFVVEDRMNRRKKNFVDVWMSTKEEAKEFGIYNADIVVLDSTRET